MRSTALLTSGGLGLVALLGATRSAGAQTLTSVSNPALSIATLSESQYDAGGPSGSTQTYAITTSCTGNGVIGCRLYVQYGSNPQGQQVGMQWALTSATAPCLNRPALNVFADIVPSTVVLTTDKNTTCVATFILRAHPLSYATFQAPGPVAGAYKQQVRFVLTRP